MLEVLLKDPDACCVIRPLSFHHVDRYLNSSVDVVIMTRAQYDFRSPAEAKGFFLQPLCPARRPTQPPVQWVPWVLSPGVKRGRGVTLTTHRHLVLGSRMSRSYTSFPPCTFMACSGTLFSLVWLHQMYCSEGVVLLTCILLTFISHVNV
jgi:hypothetical protein